MCEPFKITLFDKQNSKFNKGPSHWVAAGIFHLLCPRWTYNATCKDMGIGKNQSLW